MNCRRFQEHLYEYVEETLSPRQRASADRHLAKCGACCEAVRREQHLAQILSAGLEQDTEHLTLDEAARHRIAAALSDGTCRDTRAVGDSVVACWGRFALPVATAALVVIATVWAGIFYSGVRRPRTETAQSGKGHIPRPITIQISYVVPSYIFRKEANLVTDVLSYQTNTISQTLLVEN